MAPKKQNRGDFLNWFVGREPVKPEKQFRHSVNADKFDVEDHDRLLAEMKEYSAAEDRLTDVVDTGSSAFADTYFSLVKAEPKLRDPKLIRPSHLVNRAVIGEMMGLTEYEQMRSYCTGDEIGAALAAIAMEPELEILFDKLKEAGKLAKQIEDHLTGLAGMTGEIADLDAMIEAVTNGTADGMDENGEPINYQEQKALIEEAMQKLQEQIEQDSEALAQELGDNQTTIKSAMKSAMKSALADAEQLDGMATAWGLDPGSLQKMDAKQRIEMARKVQNEKFRRLAEILGPMQRFAFAMQQQKTVHSRDEVYDVSMGNDLTRVLPVELLAFDDEDLELEFYRRYYEGQLLQYELQGTEKLARGAIIFNEDGSGSMSGDREIWAKAVGICLLQIAKSQNRAFYGIHFGGPGALKTFDFRDSRAVTLDQILEFASIFFGGGTDFMGPLSKSLDILREEHAATGKITGDIVFVTDGQCGVNDKWLAEFKAEQERLGFRVYGVVIGGSPDSEPLKSICDGRVLTVQNLVSGEDLAQVFRSV